MNHKFMMVTLCAALAGTVGAAPNVVVFMADDFGSGCINAYGAP
jgi:hypothetical protein